MTVTVSICFMNVHQNVPCFKSLTHTRSGIYPNMGVNSWVNGLTESFSNMMKYIMLVKMTSFEEIW